MFKAPTEYMVNHPVLGMGKNNNGFFRFERDGIIYNCVSSDGGGWEHVSVTVNKSRCPIWQDYKVFKVSRWNTTSSCAFRYKRAATACYGEEINVPGSCFVLAQTN